MGLSKKDTTLAMRAVTKLAVMIPDSTGKDFVLQENKFIHLFLQSS